MAEGKMQTRDAPLIYSIVLGGCWWRHRGSPAEIGLLVLAEDVRLSL